MSAITQIKKEVTEAVVFLRENNQTIPSETIQFMKDASIEKLNHGQKFTIEEIKNYLVKSDNFGDAVYFLNVENILKANKIEEVD